MKSKNFPFVLFVILFITTTFILSSCHTSKNVATQFETIQTKSKPELEPMPMPAPPPVPKHELPKLLPIMDEAVYKSLSEPKLKPKPEFISSDKKASKRRIRTKLALETLPVPAPAPPTMDEAGYKSLPTMDKAVYKSLSEPKLKPKPEFISSDKKASKRRIRTKLASETTTTPISIKTAINDYITSLDLGKVEYWVEEKMVEGKAAKVEAFIAKIFTTDIAKTLSQRGFSSSGIRVGTFMRMSLKGSDAFKINALTDIEQTIGDKDIGKWLWDVVPLQDGQQKLTLTACVIIKMENIENIPPRCEEVFSKEFDVEVNRAYKAKIFVIHNWKEIIGLIIGSGVIGLFFNKKKKMTRKKKTE